MSSSGIRKQKTFQGRTIDIIKDQEQDFVQQLKVTSTESSFGSVQNMGETSGGSPQDPTGNYLATNGDTMIGPIAYYPVDVTIVNNASNEDDSINIGLGSQGYSSYVKINPATGTADDLVNIIGAQFSGQDLILQGVTGNTITLKTTGNIIPPGGADFDIVDEAIVRCIFDPTTDKWLVYTSGGTGGVFATIQLDNLGVTAINANLLFDAGTYNVGDATNPIDQLFMKTIRLQTGLLTANKPTITSLSGNTLDLNFPTGSSIGIYENGVTTGHAITGSSITAKALIVTQTATFSDNAIDPVSNGMFGRNGVDMKVYSGGAVRNLSDIGSGGANVNLSNLGVTAINADLLFDAATYDVGNATNPIDQLFMKTIRLQTGLLTANKPTITSLSGNTLDLNFPTGSTIGIYENGVTTGHSISGSSITAKALIVTQTATFSDNAINPVSNGMFGRNGVDMKVYSGGAVRNLSDVGTGANAQLSNLGTTAINTNLLFNAATHNVGDATNPIDQLFMKTLRIQTGVHTANKPTITSLSGSTLDINFPTGSSVGIYENGVTTGHSITGSSITAKALIVTQTATFSDNAIDPVSNGMFGRNGIDMKVYSGGAVRNLSDIGSGGDMILASVQTNTGTKTFLNTTMSLRNAANTFDGVFTHTSGGNIVWTLPNTSQTLVGTTFTQSLTNKTIDGDLNTIIDINETQMNVSVGASGTVLTSNGVGLAPTYQAAAGGSQTPWTSNIDADNWALQDLEAIQFTGSGTAPSSTTNRIWATSFGLHFGSAATTKYISFALGGTIQLQLNEDGELLWNNDGHKIVPQGTSFQILSANSGDTIQFWNGTGRSNATLQISDTTTTWLTKTADVQAVLLQLIQNNNTPADGRTLGNIDFIAENSSSVDEIYGRISVSSQDISAATEDGLMQFGVMSGGTLVVPIQFEGNNDATSDGGALGFFGVTPVARQVVAGGATVATVITALKNLGLFI